MFLLKVIKRFLSNSDYLLLKKRISNYVGICGEYFVVVYFLFCGYKFLYRRYKNYYGEIDLIFNKNKTIIFVEVKTRTTTNTHFDLVMRKQKNRIINASRIFFVRYKKYYGYCIRYDICIVSSFLPWKIRHFKDAF